MAKDVGNGYGLHVDWAGGTSWVAVGQVLSISPPPVTMGEVDVTTLDSTFTEYLPVELEDYGVMSFNIAFDPDDSAHQALYTNIVLGTIAAWKLTPPGNSGTNTRIFSGFGTNYQEGEVTPKGLLTCSFSVRLTSAINATA